MGFLDRVVADMVTKSTGFNARGLVRMVGGKRILALGGAALAGALIQDKMQGSTVGGSSSGSGSSAPTTRKLPRSSQEMQQSREPSKAGAVVDLPPLPPLPSGAGPTGASATPPPLPAQMESRPVAEEVSELPPELLYAVLRTMVAAALADGSMHEKEREAITSRLGESGLTDAQIARIHQDLLAPARPSELAAMVEPEEKELLLRFATLIALADDEVTERERTWLGQFAKALEIDREKVGQIEREIFG